MALEILEELKQNVIEMEELMSKQLFTVGAAEIYLSRYFNFVRCVEDLKASRDNWKEKYMKLKNDLSKELKELKEIEEE